MLRIMFLRELWRLYKLRITNSEESGTNDDY